MNRQLPEGWQEVRLGDVGVFSKGSGITKNELVENGIPCIRYGELYTRHNFRVQKFYSFISNKELNKRKLIINNDLLFAGSGETREEIGKCASFNHDTKVYAGGDIIVCSINSKKLRADFASYYLNTIGRRQINKLGQGDSIVHIYSRFLESIEIPLPPLPEQKAIANTLQTWDEAIEKTETLIAAKEKRFKWLIGKLINKSDVIKERLGTIANFSSGGTPKSSVSEYYGGKIPWASIADMTEKGMWVNSTHRTLTEAGLINSSAKIYPKNTVLYAMYASIGECSIAAVELSSSQAILGIEPNPKKLHFEYLYYYLNSLKERIKLQGQWGTQSNLNAGIVKDFRIPLPSPSKQKRIAHILSTAQHEIDLLKQLADRYRTQKRGLMQKLLTGEWRLPLSFPRTRESRHPCPEPRPKTHHE